MRYHQPVLLLKKKKKRLAVIRVGEKKNKKRFEGIFQKPSFLEPFFFISIPSKEDVKRRESRLENDKDLKEREDVHLSLRENGLVDCGKEEVKLLYSVYVS